MTRDIEPRSPDSLLGTLEVQTLQLETDLQKPRFVGGIRYNRGKNLLVVGEQDAKLLTANVDPVKHSDFLLTAKDTGRIISLPKINTVDIRQVDLADVEINKVDSVYKHAPLSLELNVRNPKTERTERVSIAENDLFNTFTKDRGGLIVFSGKGLPEETGLLFENGTTQERRALILFMHPHTEKAKIINSVVGLGDFLRRVNDELATDIDIALQTKALEKLSQYEKRGTVTFGSGAVRREIFRLQIIAHARNAENGDADQRRIVANLIPGTKRTVFLSPRRAPRKHQEIVDKKINSTFIDSKKQEEQTYQFKNEEGEILLQGFTDEVTKKNDSGQLGFMGQLENWIRKSADPTEFEDIEYLIDQFFSATTISEITFHMLLLPKKFNRTITVSEYRAEMQKELLKKRTAYDKKTRKLR